MFRSQGLPTIEATQPNATRFLGSVLLVAGHLTEAEELIEQDRWIARATGSPPIAYCGMLLPS
jgi:hypothetical protein